jgi:hypothetical protein
MLKEIGFEENYLLAFLPARKSEMGNGFDIHDRIKNSTVCVRVLINFGTDRSLAIDSVVLRALLGGNEEEGFISSLAWRGEENLLNRQLITSLPLLFPGEISSAKGARQVNQMKSFH